MTNTTDVDEQLAAMAQTIDSLKKSVEEKDRQIAQLMSKLELYSPGESSHNPTLQAKSVAESPTKSSNAQNKNQSVFVAALTVQQLQDMITNTIRGQYGGPPQSSLGYSKPYSKRIDCLSMPTGYQPPK